MLYESLISNLALLAEWDVIRVFSSASPVPKAAGKREAEKKKKTLLKKPDHLAICGLLLALLSSACVTASGSAGVYLTGPTLLGFHERKPHATINIICNLSLNQSHLTRFQFGLDMLFSVYFISAKLRNLIVIA